MAATHRAPKQWCLTKNETVNSYKSWRQNILYSLACDKELVDGLSWLKAGKKNQYRGLTDDGNSVAEAKRKEEG